METMKAIWWTGPDKIELLHDVPVPEIRPGAVKIAIAYAAVCATDIHMVTMGAMNARMAPGGQGLGHEGSGTIVEMGDGTEKSGLKIGDKVVMYPGAPCGECANCKDGYHQYCRNGGRFQTFSEYAVVPVSGVYKIPDDADLRAYSLVEPSVCTIRAMDLSPIRHGQKVLVSGIGGIGSILLDMVIHSGAAKITVSDPVPQKRENALAMGAQYAIDPMNDDLVAMGMDITGNRGYDHIFEVSGVPAAAQPCLELLAKCGTVTYFAVFPPTYEMPLNLHSLYMKEGRIQTVFTHPSIVHRAIDLMPRLQTDKIIGKIYDLADGMEAIEMFHKSIYPKILLKCN
ncbi:MAG: alcohol dehydrogenase catalytic domain-containing protein [Oscillospiraceae bacterium]|nr:alcohol dehydrogenase catalytic domain-containing protein [Oscillospiraceae bacterium]